MAPLTSRTIERAKKQAPSATRPWIRTELDAKAVLDYFKKYSKQHQQARAFLKTNPEMAGTPEMRTRMIFWKNYFALPPDERNAYVVAEAENHGIFVYGFFGDQENHDAEAAWTRRAIALGLKGQQLDYLRIKPLLDYFSGMPDEGKDLFLRANPELQAYFDKYKSKESLTGNPSTDKTVEEYFALPNDSDARSTFLRAHPEVQAYFDTKSSPSELAMRSLLDVFFKLPVNERAGFKQSHPEIDAYFEARKLARQSSQSAAQAFDFADPRLSPYWKEGEDLIRGAELMRRKLRDQALSALRDGTLETRRDARRPATL